MEEGDHFIARMGGKNQTDLPALRRSTASCVLAHVASGGYSRLTLEDGRSTLKSAGARPDLESASARPWFPEHRPQIS